MKNYILILVFLSASLAMRAQDYKIESFVSTTEMAARENIKLDHKDRQCAVFRIATQSITPEEREGFYFKSDYGSSVVDRQIVGGEIWLWVSPGIKTLGIYHSKLGNIELHTVNYGVIVQSLYTYKIIIQGITNEERATPEDVVQQYLTFQITPTDAMLEVDGEIWPVSRIGTARQRVKKGTYSYLVQAPLYESEDGEVTVEDTAVIVKVNLTQVPPIEKESVERWDTFVTLNAACMPLSLGVSVGQVKRFGWFVSVMSNLGFVGYTASGTCDANGFINDGVLPIYSGTVKTDRHSVMVGGMMRIAKPLYIRLGAGYGATMVSWETVDRQYYRNEGYSFQGVDVSGGLQLNLGGFVLSAEAVTTNFKTLEGKVGLGVSF